MFKSIYSEYLSRYYLLRESVLSESARKHELCYLRRFDDYVEKNSDTNEVFSEEFINKWIFSLHGKRSSIENEIIVIRQFLQYLALSGQRVFLPIIPKVYDDYVPYIFSDAELSSIFRSADNVIQKDYKTDPYLVIEFPVIIRLLYCCGLRLGETLKLSMLDADLDNGVLHLVNTKGDKHRLVPMEPVMTEILSKYCLAMNLHGKDCKWLFPSSKSNGHISEHSVKHRFERILQENGIRMKNKQKHERGPCLHCMRHVFAFKSFAKAEQEGRHLDDEIPYLSVYLGHGSLNETEKYLKFSNELFPESIYAFGDFMSGLMPEVDYEA